MLRKIVIWILCLSMVLSSMTFEARAVEYERKSLSIERLNDGLEVTYTVVSDGENVYISVEDLIQVVEFDEKNIDMSGDTLNQIILTKNAEHQGFDQDIIIFPQKKKISSTWYGTDKFKGCLNLEDGVYLDIVEIFNYLRVKAEVVDDKLLINIPVYSILDFMIYDYQSVLKNSVSQLDLLQAQENSFSSGFYDALCLACNNFDFRLLIPVWGASELKDEQYTKALQILNKDDEIFYDNNTNDYIKYELGNRGFKGVLATGEDLTNVMSIEGETIEAVEEFIYNIEDMSSEKMKAYMELINWNGENYDSIIQMRAWNKHAGHITNAIDLANIVVSTYETYTRADSWSKECLDDLAVLKNLNLSNYGENKKYVKRIKRVANECYKESANQDKASVEQAFEDVFELLLEKTITETSVYGKVADYFVLAINSGISVAKCLGNIDEELDKGELSYTITCLINIAVASRIDAEIEYNSLNLKNLRSKQVDEFRDSIRTSLKANLRCWSCIYYLNSDGSWENTYRGKEVREKINKMNTYLTLLEESAQYDYALDEYDLITYSPQCIIDILYDEHASQQELNSKKLIYEWEGNVLNISIPEVWGECEVQAQDNDEFLFVDIAYLDCQVAQIYMSKESYYTTQMSAWESYDTRIINRTEEYIVFVAFLNNDMRNNPQNYEFPYSEEICEEYKNLLKYVDNFAEGITVQFVNESTGENLGIDKVMKRLGEIYINEGAVFMESVDGDILKARVRTDSSVSNVSSVTHELEVDLRTGMVKEFAPATDIVIKSYKLEMTS